MLYLVFQNIFSSILLESKSDVSLGEDYIRFQAARFFLTDFFRHPLAYLTGNGMFYNTSRYGMEINRNMVSNHFVLGDIGIIGNYAIYGAFFVSGVLLIIIKSLKLKIESGYSYIKYMFIAVSLALLTSGSFAQADFICLIMCVLYLVDVSNFTVKRSQELKRYANNPDTL
jgi:hypothetical protein